MNSHEVRYVVFGGIAAVLHGVARNTFDVDLLIEPSVDNAGRLLSALADAGLGTSQLIEPDALLRNEITVFKDFIRVDVMTSTPGLEFEKAWGSKVRMSFHDQEFFVVSREDLIASKSAAGRPVDLEDVRVLLSLEDQSDA